MSQSTSRQPAPRLPDAIVARLFAKLQGYYGNRFMNMWKSGDIINGKDTGLAVAMDTWADELGGFADNLPVFKLVLDTLPPDPPTLPAFKEMCRTQAKRLRDETPALPAPDLSPEQREEARKKIESAVSKLPGYDFKGWAKKLRVRYLAGEGLLPSQIDKASTALEEVWENGECRAMTADELARRGNA